MLIMGLVIRLMYLFEWLVYLVGMMCVLRKVILGVIFVVRCMRCFLLMMFSL